MKSLASFKCQSHECKVVNSFYWNSRFTFIDWLIVNWLQIISFLFMDIFSVFFFFSYIYLLIINIVTEILWFFTITLHQTVEINVSYFCFKWRHSYRYTLSQEWSNCAIFFDFYFFFYFLVIIVLWAQFKEFSLNSI